MDRSRPTAATSNQDGELNQITDLIVWAQNIGWDKGRTEDLEIWLGQLRSGWNQLRSGICYGEAGQIEQQGDPARRRRSNSLLWQPEGRQTRFMKITRNTWHKTRCCGEPGSTPCSTTARPAVRRAWRLRGSSRWTDDAARTLSIFTRLCGTTPNLRSTSPDAGRMSVTATCRP